MNGQSLRNSTLLLSSWIFFALMSVGLSQTLHKNFFIKMVKNSTFSAVIDVVDGRKEIAQTLVGDSKDFRYLELRKDKTLVGSYSYLFVVNGKDAIDGFLIYMIKNNEFRFGARRNEVMTISELKGVICDGK